MASCLQECQLAEEGVVQNFIRCYQHWWPTQCNSKIVSPCRCIDRDCHWLTRIFLACKSWELSEQLCSTKHVQSLAIAQCYWPALLRSLRQEDYVPELVNVVVQMYIKKCPVNAENTELKKVDVTVFWDYSLFQNSRYKNVFVFVSCLVNGLQNLKF